MSRDFLREKIRIRDNYTCQMCHIKWCPGEMRFDVHHKDLEWEGKSHSKGIYKYDKENPDKLITLCHKCHSTLDCVKKKLVMGLINYHKRRGNNSESRN